MPKKSHFVNAVNNFRMGYTSFKPQENGVCRRQNSENLAKNTEADELFRESRGLDRKINLFPDEIQTIACGTRPAYCWEE